LTHDGTDGRAVSAQRATAVVLPLPAPALTSVTAALPTARVRSSSSLGRATPATTDGRSTRGEPDGT
jgi:hypothetical protein